MASPKPQMDQNEELAKVAQMRKSVEKLIGSSTQMYGEATLIRFLIARSMDTEKSAKMFVEWKNWRDSFVPLNCIPDSQVEDELSANKIHLQGLSKTGNPLTHNCQSQQPFPCQGSPPIQACCDGAGFVVHLLDKTIASSFREGKEIGNEKMIGILDLEQISYENIDVRGMITGFQFLQSYYPERLAKLYLLHMPRFFVSVWRLVSRFLEKATLEKIVIVRNEEERRQLVRDIGEETLPEEYEGRAKLVLLQDFVLTPTTKSSIGQ